MINKISFQILSIIIDETDTEEDACIYQFALFIIISNIIFFLFCLLIGFIFSCIAEMIIFFLAFQILRHYAGGFHSNSETKCEIISSISIFLTGFIIYLSKCFWALQLLVMLTSFPAFLVILFLSPVEAEVKPLTKAEHKKYRIISLIILLIIVCTIYISHSLKYNFVSIPCCLCLFLESILLTAGKIKETKYEK